MLRSRLRRNGGGSGTAPRWFQAIIALIGLGVIAVAVAGGVGYGVYESYASGLQPPDQVISEQPSGGAQIFDRNGEAGGRLAVDDRGNDLHRRRELLDQPGRQREGARASGA
jgi:hypothetical protein